MCSQQFVENCVSHHYIATLTWLLLFCRMLTLLNSLEGYKRCPWIHKKSDFSCGHFKWTAIIPVKDRRYCFPVAKSPLISRCSSAVNFFSSASLLIIWLTSALLKTLKGVGVWVGSWPTWSSNWQTQGSNGATLGSNEPTPRLKLANLRFKWAE